MLSLQNQAYSLVPDVYKRQEYHNTNVERLLNYAGEHCINADLLIYILEDPDVCTTYENTVGFLSQFAQASEFKMKLELARELIDATNF